MVPIHCCWMKETTFNTRCHSTKRIIPVSKGSLPTIISNSGLILSVVCHRLLATYKYVAKSCGGEGGLSFTSNRGVSLRR